MPLPDERPRQGVAALIGRFEQQTKRQSIVPSIPPRTSSVASHHTGDSAKEELKEKREWPPKLKPVVPVAPIAPEPDRNEDVKPKSPEAESPPAAVAPEPAVGETAVEPPTQALSDPAPTIQPELPVPVPKPTPQRQSSLGTTAPSRPPTTPSKGSTAVKSTAATSAKTPARTPGKVPPSSFHSTPASRSTASATPVKAAATPAKPRPSSRPSSRAGQRPSTATTPARAKTPSRAKSPAGPVRVMSPAISPARAKSPAVGQSRSGLFAPTAASLAKARNAPEHVPTPVRKSSGPTPALDRLSKPTAASLSKARTPTIVPSTRGGKAPTRGATPARGSALKPRVGLAGAKLKEAKQGATVAAEAAAATVDFESEHDVHAEEAHEQEQEASGASFVDDAEHAATDLVHEPEEYEAEHGEPHEVDVEEAHIAEDAGDHGEEGALDSLRGTEAHVEERALDADVPVESTVTQPPQTEHEPLSDEAQTPVETTSEAHTSAKLEHEVVEEDQHSVPAEDDTAHPQMNGQAGDDLEAIVNMLESGKPRPISIVSIPDETGEIPDEE